MTMPKRPRQHQLETESRSAVVRALPSQWVCRDVHSDYGIDLEIEIFDEHGYATGTKFLAQLKATDTSDHGKALKLSLARSKIEYYRSLDQPVVIIRYIAPSDAIYYCWFHRLDAYEFEGISADGKIKNSESEAGSRPWRLTQDHFVPWTEQTSHQLMDEVIKQKEIRSGVLRGPIDFVFSYDADPYFGASIHSIFYGLRKAFSRVGHVVNLSSCVFSDRLSPYCVSVTPEKIEVRIAGMHGCTLHAPEGLDLSDGRESLVGNIMVSIALAMHSKRQFAAGAEIIDRFWRESNAIRDPAIAIGVAKCLAMSGKLGTALDIAESLITADGSLDLAQPYLLPLLADQQKLN